MAVKNSLTEVKNKKKSLTAYLNSSAVKDQINNVLNGERGTRFIASVVSAVQATPALQECTNQSILSAALLGESLNLSPSPQLGQYYLVPYKRKEKKDRNGRVVSPAVTEAQFQLGYKGYIQLAARTGQYKKINVIAIKEGELVKFDPLTEEIEVNLIEDEDVREQTPTLGYYAMFEYVNGFRKAIYWSRKKMLAHADKYSNAFSRNAMKRLEAGEIPREDMWRFSSFWYKNFDAMAYKTMLRQLLSKWGIMSIDMVSAYESDMGVIGTDGSVEYVDNMDPDDVVAESEYREQRPEPASPPPEPNGYEQPYAGQYAGADVPPQYPQYEDYGTQGGQFF